MSSDVESIVTAVKVLLCLLVKLWVYL